MVLANNIHGIILMFEDDLSLGSREQCSISLLMIMFGEDFP